VRWSRGRPELLFTKTEPANLQVLVASYSVEGAAFHAGMPRPWTDGRVAFRPKGASLHPDGERIAAAPGMTAADINRERLVFVLNFFDELRRLAPATK
jgi:hypothetical protein